ncbi:hypothetical protein BST86_13995 [Nonlabens agnitus]|uniref:Uncharacterized protein n=2 Tax=Nonlabens agnitus TaxID=870484 RepID=A0A2S9WXB6_9FLAO|nr:hypothetical protein BST86_13995 [Nonlabens agnitus]
MLAHNAKDFEFNKQKLLKFLHEKKAHLLPYTNWLYFYNNRTGSFIEKIKPDNAISTLSRKLTHNN